MQKVLVCFKMYSLHLFLYAVLCNLLQCGIVDFGVKGCSVSWWPSPHLHILLPELLNSDQAPCQLAVMWPQWNSTIVLSSTAFLLGLRHTLPLTHTCTHLHTQKVSLVGFVQVKQELGLKSIPTQGFSLGHLVRLFPTVCFLWKHMDRFIFKKYFFLI